MTIYKKLLTDVANSRFSELSDETLEYLKQKITLIKDSEVERRKFIKFVSNISNVDLYNTKILFEYVEIFKAFITYEQLKRKKIINYEFDPIIGKFVDLKIFEEQIRYSKKRECPVVIC